MFRFAGNYISTKSNPMTLSDLAKAAQTKAAMAKTSTEQTVKTASVKAPAPAATEVLAEMDVKIVTARGNVSNFGDKKAKPFGKGGKGVSGEEEVLDVDKKDKKDCMKPAKKKASTEGGKSDEGETSGQLADKVNPQNDPFKDPKIKGEKGGSSKGSAESEEGESSGQLEEKANPQNDPKVDKEAQGTLMKEWFKIANLTGEQETVVRKELEKFWPKKFVDALLAKR